MEAHSSKLGLIANKYDSTKPNKLDLSNSFIRDEDMDVIIQFLKDNPQITSLNLSKNLISDGGVLVLCDYLKQEPTITQLNLSENDIDYMGIGILLSSEIKDLKIEKNKGLEPQLETSQEWFISFIQLFDLGQGDGYCDGFGKNVIFSFLRKDGEKNVLRINILLKQIFEIYKAIAENVLNQKRKRIDPEKYDAFLKEIKLDPGEKTSGYFQYTDAYTEVFLPLFEKELFNWYADLKEADQKKISNILKPLLRKISKRQNVMFNEIPSEDRDTFTVRFGDVLLDDKFFQKLSIIRVKAFKDCSFAFRFIAKKHAVSVCYSAPLNQWLLADANQTPVRFRNKVSDVRKFLEEGFFREEGDEPLTVRYEVHARKEDKAKIKQLFNDQPRKNFFNRNKDPLRLGGVYGAVIALVIVVAIMAIGIAVPPLGLAFGLGVSLGVPIAAAIGGYGIGAGITALYLKIKEKMNFSSKKPVPQLDQSKLPDNDKKAKVSDEVMNCKKNAKSSTVALNSTFANDQNYASVPGKSADTKTRTQIANKKDSIRDVTVFKHASNQTSQSSTTKEEKEPLTKYH